MSPTLTFTKPLKMAAAFSVQAPIVVSVIQENSRLPGSDISDLRQDEETVCVRDLHDLEPGEIRRRLEETHRELSNRRKIIIKHLPQDITSQEVRNILCKYELKFCYVDRNKGTAFVTLLNGDQAQDAMRSLHKTPVRSSEITVQLQSTDALLCVTNLPHTLTAAQFQELVQVHGNLERCFLVYSERTGHSKGYGFAEYMRKDSASRARCGLSGLRCRGRVLAAQWVDASRLTPRLLHSKCLRVDRLPRDLNSEELSRIFGGRHKPIFCQLAQDEDSHTRGFAVLEYETAEQAEAVLMDMDRRTVKGQEVHVSLCTPGVAGMSTMAALIAAQGMAWSKRKGLLPEPSIAQLLNSMSNPATLQALGMPYQNRKFTQHQGAPFLQHPLSSAFLRLGNSQQDALLGNGLVLQTLLRMQLAQQQLLCIKDKQFSAAPGLLGDPSRELVLKALGLQAGGSPSELSPDAVRVCGLGPVAESAGAMPCPPVGRHQVPLSSEQSGASVTEIRLTPRGNSNCFPTPSLTQGNCRSLKCTPNLHQRLHSARLNSTATVSPAGGPTSLLGEPPKDMKLSSNPYLNLASVLPCAVLQGTGCSKAQSMQPRASIHDANQYCTDITTEYTQQYSPQHSQEATQPWYLQYQAQDYVRTALEGGASEYGKECNQAAGSMSYLDYSTYAQAASQYYSQPQLTPTEAHTYHRDINKEGELLKMLQSGGLHSVSNDSHPGDSLPTYSCLTAMPACVTPHDSASGSAACPETRQTHADWSQFFCNQTRRQKRDYSQLPGADLVSDQAYLGQYSQTHQQDYSKKRRL